MEFSEIRAVLESAFKPLEIGLWHDYESKFNLRVFEKTSEGKRCIYQSEEVITDDVSNHEDLKSFVGRIRAELRTREPNLKLYPWKFPDCGR